MKKISLKKYARLHHVMRFGDLPERHVSIKHELAITIIESAKNLGRYFIAPLRIFRRR